MFVSYLGFSRAFAAGDVVMRGQRIIIAEFIRDLFKYGANISLNRERKRGMQEQRKPNQHFKAR